jgi:hypothetical protein
MLVAAWRESEAEIRQAFGLLVSAEKRLKDTFKPDSYLFSLSRTDSRYRRYEDPDELLKELKKDVWRVLIDRMELRRILSVKRNEELNRQIETGQDLPDIDEAQILAMLEATLTNTSTFIEEAVQEVFEYLRPRNSRYKTNTEFEIGKRVILSWAIETKWAGGFHVNSYREQMLRAVDNVFHALDGNGTIKTHRGPLIDAIEASSTGIGETEYFRFKCCRNHSLHLVFKRLDLVAKLNAVAGGMRLRGESGQKG